MRFGERKIGRRQFLRLAAGGTLALGAGGWHSLVYSPTHPRISRRHVRLPGLPDAFRGLRIVHLTDLHFSSMVSRAYLEKCVKMSNALDPDLILLTGDYLTISDRRSGSDVISRFGEGLTEILSGFRARDGIFAVLGNHDVTLGAGAVRSAVERAGILVLRDEARFLEREGQRLPLVGLADFGTQHVRQQRAFAGLENSEPALILMHNPDLFEIGLAHDNGIVFSGHTHGGQMLFPLLGALYVPSRFGDKFLKGWFQKGDLSMIVNRGLGMIRIPARLNCPPEIAEVILA